MRGQHTFMYCYTLQTHVALKKILPFKNIFGKIVVDVQFKTIAHL